MKRSRRNHSATFKAKVVLTAIKDSTLKLGKYVQMLGTTSHFNE